MGAFIVSPSEDDRVASPVKISIDYSFTASTNVQRFVGTDHDAGVVLGLSGKHTSDVNTTLMGPQRVCVKSGGIELSSQDNVHVLGAGPIPIDIDVAAQEVQGEGKHVVIVKGTCQGPWVPAHPFVASVIYSINPNGVRTAVAIGFDVPQGKENEYKIKLIYKPEKNLVYIVRSFLVDFQNPFTVVGATTKSLGG